MRFILATSQRRNRPFFLTAQAVLLILAAQAGYGAGEPRRLPMPSLAQERWTRPGIGDSLWVIPCTGGVWGHSTDGGRSVRYMKYGRIGFQTAVVTSTGRILARDAGGEISDMAIGAMSIQEVSVQAPPAAHLVAVGDHAVAIDSTGGVWRIADGDIASWRGTIDIPIDDALAFGRERVVAYKRGGAYAVVSRNRLHTAWDTLRVSPVLTWFDVSVSVADSTIGAVVSIVDRLSRQVYLRTADGETLIDAPTLASGRRPDWHRIAVVDGRRFWATLVDPEGDPSAITLVYASTDGTAPRTYDELRLDVRPGGIRYLQTLGDDELLVGTTMATVRIRRQANGTFQATSLESATSTVFVEALDHTSRGGLVAGCRLNESVHVVSGARTDHVLLATYDGDTSRSETCWYVDVAGPILPSGRRHGFGDTVMLHTQEHLLVTSGQAGRWSALPLPSGRSPLVATALDVVGPDWWSLRLVDRSPVLDTTWAWVSRTRGVTWDRVLIPTLSDDGHLALRMIPVDTATWVVKSDRAPSFLWNRRSNATTRLPYDVDPTMMLRTDDGGLLTLSGPGLDIAPTIIRRYDAVTGSIEREERVDGMAQACAGQGLQAVLADGGQVVAFPWCRQGWRSGDNGRSWSGVTLASGDTEGWRFGLLHRVADHDWVARVTTRLPGRGDSSFLVRLTPEWDDVVSAHERVWSDGAGMFDVVSRLDGLHIGFGNDVAEGPVVWTVYDMVGATVAQGTAQGGSVMRLAVPSMVAGGYTVRLYSTGQGRWWQARFLHHR